MAHANPQFRALRARASGLAASGSGLPQAPAPAQPQFQAVNQPQPAYQQRFQAAPQQYAQPQYQYQGAAPFGGFQQG